MADTYARSGAPFHFQGTLTETQREALELWVEARKDKHLPISAFHQVQAYRLRKTAGLLEHHYKNVDPRGLEPTFRKDPWNPKPGGHFSPSSRDDQEPGNAVATIKEARQSQFALDEEAVFRMNFLRTRLEFQEDLAQEAFEADTRITKAFADLMQCFSDHHYRGACIRDKTDLFQGKPRFRVHPLDPPTPYELQQAGPLPSS